MLHESEKVQAIKVRVFQWEDTMLSETYDDCVVFMVRVWTKLRTITNNPKKRGLSHLVTEFSPQKNVIITQIVSLDLLKYYVHAVLAKSESFFEGTIPGLAQRITSYLKDWLQINRNQMLEADDNCKIVFVADVYTSRLTDESSLDDEGEEEGDEGMNKGWFCGSDEYHDKLYNSNCCGLKLEEVGDNFESYQDHEHDQILGDLMDCLVDTPEFLRSSPVKSLDIKGFREVFKDVRCHRVCL